MSDLAAGIMLLSVMTLLLSIRVPIGIALIGTSFVGLWALLGWNVAWNSLSSSPHQYSVNWVLSSVPTFLFMGYICFYTDLTRSLFRSVSLWLSGLPGGLAVASVLGCSAFAAVTGSSVACSAAMGKIAIPEMLDQGYEPGLATGTVAVSGTIGALIPPSILLIMFGILAQAPIKDLFFGGLVIGLMSMASYIVLIIIRVMISPKLGSQTYVDRVPLREKLASLLDIWPLALIITGVFGGLFSGVFTPVEAGAVGGTLSCVAAALNGTMSFAALRRALSETVVTTASILLIAIGASLLTRFFALSGFGPMIQDFVFSFGLSPIAIMTCIVLLYLILGTVFEPLSAMILTLPVVLPIVAQTGFELVWFGILLAKLLEMGMVTPPVGMNVFVVKGVVGDRVSTGVIYQGVVWFFVVDLLLIAILVAFPGLIPTLG